MSLLVDHPRLRWVAPAAAVAVIAAGGVFVSRIASADTGLPPRSAAQLLADVQQASRSGLSGTVVQTANLGIPQIPSLSGNGTGAVATGTGVSSLTSIIAGTHTWRVWLAGEQQSRLALLSGANESDIIRNESDLWVWSSRDKSATHYTLPASAAASPTPPVSPTDLPKTPADAASEALAAIDPSTSVTTDGAASVAGRQAYELVLQPKSQTTRVAQVRIAIDSETHIPLRVQVYSTKAANPAFEVGFTSVDFSTPDARQFQFTPPSGTKVTNSAITPQSVGGGAKPATLTHRLVGTGWDSVLVATLPADLATRLGQLKQLLTSLPSVSGSWGRGRVIDGTLFSAVLTEDGRVAVGAVSPNALYAALSAP
ncbi:MAG: sigma-E factor regulatory protein RseB domain-containing protein [Terracoccus sp.]